MNKRIKPSEILNATSCDLAARQMQAPTHLGFLRDMDALNSASGMDPLSRGAHLVEGNDYGAQFHAEACSAVF